MMSNWQPQPQKCAIFPYQLTEDVVAYCCNIVIFCNKCDICVVKIINAIYAYFNYAYIAFITKYYNITTISNYIFSQLIWENRTFAKQLSIVCVRNDLSMRRQTRYCSLGDCWEEAKQLCYFVIYYNVANFQKIALMKPRNEICIRTDENRLQMSA